MGVLYQSQFVIVTYRLGIIMCLVPIKQYYISAGSRRLIKCISIKHSNPISFTTYFMHLYTGNLCYTTFVLNLLNLWAIYIFIWQQRFLMSRWPWVVMRKQTRIMGYFFHSCWSNHQSLLIMHLPISSCVSMMPMLTGRHIMAQISAHSPDTCSRSMVLWYTEIKKDIAIPPM